MQLKMLCKMTWMISGEVGLLRLAIRNASSRRRLQTVKTAIGRTGPSCVTPGPTSSREEHSNDVCTSYVICQMCKSHLYSVVLICTRSHTCLIVDCRC